MRRECTRTDRLVFCGLREIGGIPGPGVGVSRWTGGSEGQEEDDVHLGFWCRAGGRVLWICIVCRIE